MIYSSKLKAQIGFAYGKASLQFFACKKGDNNLPQYLQGFELYPRKTKHTKLSPSRQELLDDMRKKCYFTCLEELKIATLRGRQNDNLAEQTRFHFGQHVKREYITPAMEY